LLRYDTTSNTLVGGFAVKPSDRLRISVDLAYNEADASLAPFELSVPAAYLAGNPNQSFDFSMTHLYSDLDYGQWEAGVEGRYAFSDRLWLVGGYRYLQFDDKAPYLYDTSGDAAIYHLRFGWGF
jgi:hypothetical protein